MTLDRTKYSFLERLKARVAEREIEANIPNGVFPQGAADFCDKYYRRRQTRMDEAAKDVLANLWAMNRPTVIKTQEDIANANLLLQQLANESWQVALALEQTRIGYDCRAMREKRAQEAEKAAAEVHNVD